MTEQSPDPFDPLRDAARRAAEHLEAIRRTWSDRYAEHFAQLHAALVASVTPKFDALAAALQTQDFAPQFTLFSQRAAEAARAMLPALEEIRRSWEESQPRNWRDLELNSIMEAIDVMSETGFCLVWTPRAAIVQAVLDAEPSQRSEVLRARSAEILDDLEAVLAEVTAAELADPRRATDQAIAAFRAGLFVPAQATAAVVFSHFIAATLRRRTKTALALFKEEDPKDATIYEFRLRAIYAAAAKALERYNPVPNTPLRVNFNRHSSLHRVMPEQYTELNALVGLMLVVPLLRELDYWFKKQAAVEADTQP